MRSASPHPSRRSRSVVVAFAVVPLALAVAGPAAADSPWSSPKTVGPSGIELNQFVVGTHGASLVYGYGSDSELVPVSAAGRPGKVRRVPNVSEISGSGDRAVYLRSATRDGPQGVSFGDLGARSLGALHLVTRGKELAEDLVVGPGGHVLVVVAAKTPPDEGITSANERYRLAWSTAGHRSRWSSLPVPGRAALLDATLDRRGAGVLLLQHATRTGYVVAARTFDLRTRRLGPERTLDHTKYDSIDGSVSVDEHGGAVLAWGIQDGGEEADHPYVVRAAFRRRGRTTYTSAVTLDPGGTRERPGGVPQTAMDDQGRAAVAWTQAIGELDGPTSPRVAVATRTDRFGPTTALLPEGYVNLIAVHGGTTAVSVTGSAVAFDPKTNSLDAPPPTVAGVAFRRDAGPFGAIEPVATATPGDRGGLLIDSGTTGFRAVWEGARAENKPALRWASRPLG
ncbi:hypothetical protein AB0L40_04240 [Patulibacter sp. NPDC049589]|uniref:hypothetical protein n=1 Tax=Patulibacter sp. NPDC049589 TaxID=3154731 RepID=UPI00343F802A